MCRECLQASEALQLGPEDWLAQITTMFLKCSIYWRSGHFQEALSAAEQGLRLARDKSQRNFEGVFLNMIAINSNDLALKGSLYEQSQAAFEAVGNHPRQAASLSNISFWLYDLGMYERAVEVARQSLQMAQEMHLEGVAIYALDNLGLALGESGDLPAAQACLDNPCTGEKTAITIEAENHMYKGLLMLYQGLPQQALQELQTAEMLQENVSPLTRANRLAHQASARRLVGDRDQACQLAEQAVSLVTTKDFGSSDFSPNMIYWWCYRALVPETSNQSSISDAAWQALDLGRQALLVPVENMSDAGLRRGYLHRVCSRRLLVREWLKWAPSRVKSEEMDAFTAQLQRPGRLNDVFRRLLEVGVRLNAHATDPPACDCECKWQN
jgi:tetratricopeptide (TPR) repeat protein